MKRCLFVVNPISGGIDKEDFLQRIEGWCAAREIVCTIFKTNGENDCAELAHLVENFQPDAVAACGGDGTVNLVGQVLLGKDIPIGIIPLGSANGMATELAIPAVAEEALAILLTGHKQSLDVVCINRQHYSFHLSDMGFNAVIIDNFERSRLRGQLAYLLFFIKSLFSDHTRRYRFLFPDQDLTLRAAMVVIANGRKYGIGADVNPAGRPGDGRFEVCIFRKYPWYAFFGMLFHFLTGDLMASRYYKVIPTNRVQIFASRPVELQVDGEALGAYSEVHAEVLSGDLQVLVPENHVRSPGGKTI